ncbi:hypothetical protein TNCV_1880931 [Trichonephila clavipes]|nr:hypothetical protein TNCV_1880931 [Trichonephila clavipes]
MARRNHLDDFTPERMIGKQAEGRWVAGMVLDLVSRTRQAVGEEDAAEVDKLLEVVGAVFIKGGSDSENDVTVTKDADGFESRFENALTMVSRGLHKNRKTWQGVYKAKRFGVYGNRGTSDTVYCDQTPSQMSPTHPPS